MFNFKRFFEKLRVLDIFFKRLEGSGINVAGANAFIDDEFEIHRAFNVLYAVLIECRSILASSHSKEHARVSVVVNVMINAVETDGGHIG